MLTNPQGLVAAWNAQQGQRALVSGHVLDEERRQLKRKPVAIHQKRQRLLIAFEQEAIELEELTGRRRILEDKTCELQRRLQGLEPAYLEGMALSELAGTSVRSVDKSRLAWSK